MELMKLERSTVKYNIVKKKNENEKKKNDIGKKKKRIKLKRKRMKLERSTVQYMMSLSVSQ